MKIKDSNLVEQLSEEAQEAMHEREYTYKANRLYIGVGTLLTLFCFGGGFGTCAFNTHQGIKAEVVKVEAERLETERARYVAEKTMWEHYVPTEKK